MADDPLAAYAAQLYGAPPAPVVASGDAYAGVGPPPTQPQPDDPLAAYAQKLYGAPLGAAIKAAGGAPGVGSVPMPPPDTGGISGLAGAVGQAALSGVKAAGAPIAGLIGRIPGVSDTDVGQALQALPQSVNQEAQQNAQSYLEQNPSTTAAVSMAIANAAGQVVPTLAGGAGLASAGAKAAETALPFLPGAVARTAGAVAGGATEGAAYDVGSGGSGKTGALIGGVAGGGLTALAGALEAGAFKKALADSLAGEAVPSEDAILRDTLDKQSGLQQAADMPPNDLAEAGNLVLSHQQPALGLPATTPEAQLYHDTYGIRNDPWYLTQASRVAGQRAMEEIPQKFPDQQLRDDLYFALQKQSPEALPPEGQAYENPRNPLMDEPTAPDTPEAVMGRIMAHPQADDALQFLEDTRQEFDNYQKAAQDLGADPSYHEGWLHLGGWEPPESAETVRPQGGTSFGLGSTTDVSKERAFYNAADKMDAGWTPPSGDLLSTSVAQSRVALGEALARQKMIEQIATAPAELADGTPAITQAAETPGKGYIELRPGQFPVIDAAMQMRRDLAAEAAESAGQLPADTTGAAGNSIYIHPQMWRNVSPMLGSRWENIPGFDQALSAAKLMDVAFGMFHQYSLSEALVRDLGLINGTGTALQGGLGLPYLSQALKGRMGPAITDEMTDRALRSGVGLGASPDLDPQPWLQFSQKMEDWAAQKGLVGKVMAAPLQGATGALDTMQKALWDYHAMGKTVATNSLLDRWGAYRATGDLSNLTVPERAYLAARPGAGTAIRTMPELDFMRTVGDHVNDNFGHQAWELLDSKMLSNPDFLQVARRAFFSPDWNISAIRGSTAPLSTNPLRAALGVNALANTAKMYGLANIVNYLGTGINGGVSHAMWNNMPGKTMTVQFGPDNYQGNGIDGQQATKAGKQTLFLRGFKHEQEAPDAFGLSDLADMLPNQGVLGAIRRAGDQFESPYAPSFTKGLPGILGGSEVYFALRKMNPMLGGAVAAATGKYPSGYPSMVEKLEQQAAYKHSVPNRNADAIARLMTLAGGWMPFLGSSLASTAEAPSDTGAVQRDLLRLLGGGMVQNAPKGKPWPELTYDQSVAKIPLLPFSPSPSTGREQTQ